MKKLKEKLSAKLSKNGGFTLVEMLIVVAIIAILVVVSIPVVGSSLDNAKKAADDANERAAKAVATIVYLDNQAEETPKALNTLPKYYDAGKGMMVDAKTSITAYNKTERNSITAGEGVIEVTYNEVSSTDAAVTFKWVSKSGT